MQVIFSDDNFTKPTGLSLFLAGPSPRNNFSVEANWRLEAIKYLQSCDTKDLTVHIPLPSGGIS